MVTRQIRIEAAASETRTQLAPDGYNVQWSPGDRIGVYVESGGTFTTANAPLTFEGTEASSSGTFSGEITLTEGATSYTLYAYYPYSETGASSASSVSFTLATQQTQSSSGDSSTWNQRLPGGRARDEHHGRFRAADLQPRLCGGGGRPHGFGNDGREACRVGDALRDGCRDGLLVGHGLRDGEHGRAVFRST